MEFDVRGTLGVLNITVIQYEKLVMTEMSSSISKSTKKSIPHL